MEFPRQAPGRALTTGTAESLSLSEGRPGGTEFGAGTHGVLLVGGPGALGPPLFPFTCLPSGTPRRVGSRVKALRGLVVPMNWSVPSRNVNF